MHRVAITGLGCVTAIGSSVDEFWDSIVNAKTGIAPTTLVSPDLLNIKISAEVKNFDPAQHFDEKRLPLLDRISQFALVATRQAVVDSGLAISEELGTQSAVIIGTGAGGMVTIDETFERLYAQGRPRVHPFTIPRLMVSAAASHISIETGITGPVYTCSSACSSSNHAIGDAFWMVRSGRVRTAITGGCESCITLVTLRGWEAMRVLATETCRPFSIDRDGMVIGEGAGMFVLERLDDARARGAKIYAELVGCGMSADAHDIVLPTQQGAERAMQSALADSGLSPKDITYVNAHGTGTPANDVTETKALRAVFQDHADKLAVSSTKSMHGHVLGGAGAIELIATTKAISEGVIPPTANFTRADPECDLDYVPNNARQLKINAALSNSFAFGGLNAVLALKSAT